LAKLHAVYTKTTRGKTEEIDLMVCYARAAVMNKKVNIINKRAHWSAKVESEAEGKRSKVDWKAC